ncbi:hypothetical protein Tco_0914674 [Tanacetum coccineum]
METKDNLSSCSNSEEQQMQQIQDNAKKSCMVSFRQLHSHLKLLSHNDLKGTRIESGFKHAFAILFGQDVETFIGTMFLNVEQLEKQLDKEEFQEIGSMAAFKVLETQFQMFIKSRIYLDDEYVVMTRNYFLQYTQLAIPKFRDTLIQHMESVKKSIDERALHKREYDTRVNERQLQIQECKVQEVKASDACSGDNDCSRIVSDKGNDQGLENQSNTSGDESSRSRNECNDKSTSRDDTDIRPSYDTEPMVEVPYTAEYNVFAVDTQHSEQPESISHTCVVEKGDSNVIPDSPDMCDNDIQNDQNVVECDDERVALANLIANLKLDVEDNKTIQKQLKKANALLTQELTECKSTLEETTRALGESNSTQDICLIAFQNQKIELEKYKTYLNRPIENDKLELKRKLKETLGLLAQKENDIKKASKLKAYEIFVVKKEHDDLVKQSLLTKSRYKGLVNEKNQKIKDLKLKEENVIDKMITMEKQLKFLNEIVYKRNQPLQTIHMLAPKGSTYNGKPTFANPRYLKKAQSEKPYLYEIPYDQSDPTNILLPDKEETLTLEKESRSKLNKDLVKPYDYTKQNSLYEIFRPPSQEYLDQLARANEIRKKHVEKILCKI